MTNFKSHIYKREEADEGNSWIAFLIFLLLTTIGIIVIDIYEKIAALLIVISGIGGTIYLYRDWGKSEPTGEYVGNIELSPEQFIINEEILSTSLISELEINIDHSVGFKMWHQFGYTVSSGTNNHIDVIAGGKRSFANFQLLSRHHLEELKQVLEGLYEKGIFVKEFHLGKRTYLLKDLNYEEIQEFKAKYNLSNEKVSNYS